MSDSDSDAEQTIADDVVVTKYKMAGDMSNSEFDQSVLFLIVFKEFINKFISNVLSGIG